MDMLTEAEVQDDSATFSIVQDKILGFQFVATRDLPAGSIILKEELPVIKIPMWHPTGFTSQFSTCLGCGFHIEIVNYLCKSCGWPLCDDICEKLPDHLENECKIFASQKFNFPPSIMSSSQQDEDEQEMELTAWKMHQLILIMRAIALRSRCPGKFQELMSLQSTPSLPSTHSNVIQANSKIQDEINTLAKYFDFQQLNFSQTEMSKLFWILNINAFMSQDFDQFGNQRYRIDLLYTKACRVNNSCVPNSSHSILPKWPKFSMTIRTAVAVEKSDPLTILYAVESIRPTQQRQLDLKQNFYFSCSCPRCVDPTELNTLYSGLVCNQCKESGTGVESQENNEDEGYLLPESPLEFEHQQDSLWKCNKCGTICTSSDLPILIEINEVGQILRPGSGVDLDVEEIEEVIEFYKVKIVHKNHWVIQLAAERFLQIVYRSKNPDFYLQEFKKYKKFSMYRLAIEDSVSPGISYFRGLIQWKLCQIIVIFLESKDKDRLNDYEDDQILCQDLLKEALKYFEYFRTECPHGQLICESLHELKHRLNNILG